MKYRLFGWIIALVVPAVMQAQQAIHLSLEEAIAMARVKSVDASVALNELRTAYWHYRTYQANLLPEVTFQATTPSYHKQYTPYMNDQGSYSFVRNNYLGISGELQMKQNIWLTGGSVALTTSIDYLRQLEGQKYDRYMSIPLALTLNQPLFDVNHTKWNRRIEPMRYAEAKAQFISASEEVALMAINRYFNLLMAMESRDIARQNLENAGRLYQIAQEKRNIGQISKNDLLQMELNLLNSRSAMTEAESEYKSMMFQLQAFLDIDSDTEVVPQIPDAPEHVELTYADALDKALHHNKFSLNLRRRQLEADYQVACAKGNLRKITLYAQVGYTGTGHDFRGAYNPLRDNQVVEVGVNIPLLDWGKRRGQVKVAESNRHVVEERVRQEQQNFSQEMYVLVERFNNQQQQVGIALRADTIAQQRYRTNVETYMIGRLSTLDLNDSQVSKDEARLTYVNQLYLYWYYLYQLRSLTLWDYAGKRGIDADIEMIIRK